MSVAVSPIVLTSPPGEEPVWSWRARLHYMAALIIMAIYGGQVCPFLESLTVVELVLPMVLALLGLAVIRARAMARWVLAAPFPNQVGRVFVGEFALFAAGGAVLALGNTLMYGFPLTSGLKLLVGFTSLGFFAALDLALERQRGVVRLLHARGQHIDIQGPFFSLMGKFILMAVGSVLILLTVLFFVLNKDLDWLVQVSREIPLAEAQGAILGELAFVSAVLLVHQLNVIISYSRTLALFLEGENRVLAQATAGNLAARVTVASHDEFGVMAHHTNAMIQALEKSVNELERTRQAAIISLSALAETRDPETGAHLLRTQRYVRALAEYLAAHGGMARELTPEVIELLFHSAPLHDIGKVGIPDPILLKPGKLDEAEFAVMKTHAILGARALEAAEAQLGESSFLRHGREIAASHHEKWDGSGYPLGLAGEAIPLSGRLMAVADVYDALISKRVYKPAFPHEQAMEILRQGRGSHFDPRVLDALLAVEEGFREIARRFQDEHAPSRAG